MVRSGVEALLLKILGLFLSCFCRFSIRSIFSLGKPKSVGNKRQNESEKYDCANG